MLVALLDPGIDASDGDSDDHGRALGTFAVHFNRAVKPMEIAAHTADELMNGKSDLGAASIDIVRFGRRGKRGQKQWKKTANFHEPPLSRVSNLSNATRDDGSLPKRCPNAAAAVGFAP